MEGGGNALPRSKRRLPGGDEENLVQGEPIEELLRDAEMTQVDGVEGPAKDPQAHPLLSELAGAIHDKLGRGELLQSYRAAGVELRRGDPHLRPHAKLSPIGQTG